MVWRLVVMVVVWRQNAFSARGHRNKGQKNRTIFGRNRALVGQGHYSQVVKAMHSNRFDMHSTLWAQVQILLVSVGLFVLIIRSGSGLQETEVRIPRADSRRFQRFSRILRSPPFEDVHQLTGFQA